MYRLCSLVKNIIYSNFSCLKFPYKLTFILTYRCNLACQICRIWQRKNYPELSLCEIEKFFQKSNYFNWINISGGEIFLREDLVDIIKVLAHYCKGLYLLDFPTNGFLTERIENNVRQMLKIKDFPPHLFITVSMDGPEDLHDKLRGRVGSWRRALDTFIRLRQIKDRRLKVLFGMTISSLNVKKIDDTLDSLRQYLPYLSYRDLHINLWHHSEHYYQDDGSDGADKNDLKKYLGDFIKKQGWPLSPTAYLESRYQVLTRKFIDSQKTPLPCKALLSSCFIDPDGNIFPCSIMGYRLGNIRDYDYDYDLSKLWLSKELYNLRHQINKGLCPQCWTPCEVYQTILGNLFLIWQK
jgi:radical SAM protein with 4Fe4S-binding SPASM domain